MVLPCVALVNIGQLSMMGMRQTQKIAVSTIKSETERMRESCRRVLSRHTENPPHAAGTSTSSDTEPFRNTYMLSRVQLATHRYFLKLVSDRDITCILSESGRSRISPSFVSDEFGTWRSSMSECRRPRTPLQKQAESAHCI